MNDVSEQSASVATSARRDRIRWIDTARGLGIILVVYGHALRGQIAAGLHQQTIATQVQDRLIYAFHMPLFFVLSGLVSRRSLERGRAEFLRTRVRTVIYPYVLWSLLQGGLSIVAADYANRPETIATLAHMAWQPIGQFWFLYVLLLCQLTLLLPVRLMYALVPVAVVLNLRFGSAGMLERACGDLPFFVLGFWLAGTDMSGWLASRLRTLAAGMAAWTLFGMLAWLGEPGPVVNAMLAITGIIGVIALAGLMQHGSAMLLMLGRASMAIYVAHVIATAAARAVSADLAIASPAAALLLVTIAGLIGPLLLYFAAERYGWTVMLGFGAPSRKPTMPGERADPHRKPIVETL